MVWTQVLFIVFTTAGFAWITHRETSKEMKDFHGRLCALEEKYIQMMERSMEKRL